MDLEAMRRDAAIIQGWGQRMPGIVQRCAAHVLTLAAEVERLRYTLMEEDLKSEESRFVEAGNYAAEETARLLLAIVRTGEHRGTFGSPVIEEAAQAILRLRGLLGEWRDTSTKTVCLCGAVPKCLVCRTVEVLK